MSSVFDEPVAANEAYQEREVLSVHAYPGGPRSLNGLFVWLAGGLKIYMVAEIVLALSSVFLAWLYLPSTVVPFTYEQLVTIDWGIRGAWLVQIVSFVFCVVMVCRVTYRAMRNLHTINSDEAEMSPGWAVGWYFIPFANLWKPAEGMSQIYHGTYQAVGEKSRASSPIPAWWTLWLVGNFAANISQRMSGGFNGENFTTGVFVLDTISSLSGALCAYLLLRLLRRVNERQELLKHGGVATVFD